MRRPLSNVYSRFLPTDARATVRCLSLAIVAFVGACGGGEKLAPRVPAKLVFVSQPTSVVAGVAPNIQVAIQDSSGVTVTTATNAVSLALDNANGATLAGTTTANAVAGVATFSAARITQVGSGYTLVASSGSLTAATSNTFFVASGPAKRLAVTAQPTDVAAGATMAPDVEVTLYDEFDNVAINATGSVTATTTQNVGFNGGGPVTPMLGVATFSNINITKAGGYTLSFSTTGAPAVSSNSFVVRAGAPNRLQWASLQTSYETEGPLGPNGAVLEVTDQFGNVIDTATNPVTIAFAANPTNAVLKGTLTVNAVAGIARFPDARIDRPGTGYKLKATAPGVADGPMFQPFSVQLHLDDISAGGADVLGSHSCGVSQRNVNGQTKYAAYCWGSNTYGQLGDGTTDEHTLPVPVAGDLQFASISAGGTHTCGVTIDDTLYCWGNSSSGQIGAAAADTKSPVLVGTYIFVSAGRTHTCAATQGGTAYCWGFNSNGQLGDGTTSPRSTPTAVTGAVGFVKVYAGTFTSCGTEQVTGKGYCWGLNASGQLGDASTSQKLSPSPIAGNHVWLGLGVGDNHTCGFASDFTTYCWGNDGNGQAGDGTPGGLETSSPTAIVGGIATRSVTTFGYANCITGTASPGAPVRAYCWGTNDKGQLGIGSKTPPYVGTPGAVLGNFAFDKVDIGSSHACALLSRVAYCWGNNDFGELGDGTKTEQLSPVRVAPYP